LSIVLNITFAFLAAVSGGTADSHYSVLMIIPILSAAYRFSMVRTLMVTGITILLTFLEVWLFFRANPPADVSEYFEAATVSLVFLVVAIVVWLLVGNLRNEEEKLGKSLDDLQKLQEKLVAEEKLSAIGQLSSAIAHEIRNPVTMIASSLKMAEKHEPGSAMRLEMFNIATEEAKRLETMTTDFLAFARTKPPERKPVAIRDLLDYIAGLAKARLIEKEISIQVECDEKLTFDVDASQMQQERQLGRLCRKYGPGNTGEPDRTDIRTICYQRGERNRARAFDRPKDRSGAQRRGNSRSQRARQYSI
jgi:signal transduction histidine kinase